MKAFSFRLDRLLRLKADAEQQQARVMGNAAREEAVLEQLCVDQAGYVADVGVRASPRAGQPTSAGVLRALHLTTLAARNQLADAERARMEARTLADTERARLSEARRERRTLERLKENQKAAWGQDLVRDERKTMDEVASRARGNPNR